MNIAETICFSLNRLWGGPAKNLNQQKEQADTPAHRAVQAKRSKLKDPSRAAKYESGSFVRRYQHRLGAYRHIGDHERIFKDKVVLDLGSGRGEGVFHLVFDKQAKYVIGVDIEERLCLFAREMITDYQISNARVLCADAAAMADVESGSVDVIVSAATFEHVQDLNGVMREAYRVLKPGGILYAQFSPIWTNYSGAHLTKWLPFPWTHLLFKPETVQNVLAKVRGVDPSTITIYEGLNRRRLQDYRAALVSSQFQILAFMNVSYHPIKKWIVRLPWVSEYISGGTVMFAQKPATG